MEDDHTEASPENESESLGELEERDIVEKEKDLEENLEKDTNEMLEVNLELPKDLEINSLKLKKPNEVYIDMYEQTLKKAKLAKRLAIEAYLEAKEIKRTYMLDLDEYLDDDLEKIINSSSNSKLEKKLNNYLLLKKFYILNLYNA